jgi:RNA-directed DNA polymerase
VCKGRDTWVLEADIQGFFDNIAHESILKQLSNFPGRNLIKGWLKAGFIFEGKYNPTETGTPQGGVCSPLLANIGLHGLETHIKSTNPKLGVVRYADDFIVTARDKGSLESAQIQIQQWLSERGLNLSAEKTCIKTYKVGKSLTSGYHTQTKSLRFNIFLSLAIALIDDRKRSLSCIH